MLPSHHRPRIRPASLLGLLGLCAAAQTQETPPPRNDTTAQPKELRQDLADLAKVLAAAHGIDATAPEIKSFRAQVGMEPRQEQAVAFEVQVDFQAPRALRCEAKEKGVQVERGFDPKLGAWAISNGQMVKLQGPDHNLEVEEIEREQRLCQQLIRFLNPGRLLAALNDPTPVRQADLEVTKRFSFAGCTVVEGTIDRIPTYSLRTDGRARVTLFLHPQTKQLLAVQALPLGEGDQPNDLAELVVLDQYAETKGVRLPTKLNVYRLRGPGRELLMTVHIRAIELGMEFGAHHFARPK